VPALADGTGLLGLLAQFLRDAGLAESPREVLPLPGVKELVAEEDNPVLV
jgi:hypothetical protein